MALLDKKRESRVSTNTSIVWVKLLNYSEQSSAPQLKERPAELHEEDDDAPEIDPAVGLGSEGRNSVGPHHDQAGESR